MSNNFSVEFFLIFSKFLITCCILQPLWADSDEGGKLVDANSNNRAKSLSKIPSFCPQRVSPRAIARQRSLKKSDYEADSCSSDNLSDSSSDSEAEKEVGDNIKLRVRTVY